MACPSCGADNLKQFFLAESVPVFCNVLLDTPGQALAAKRGEVRLVFCPDCQLIHNASFDPGLLSYSPAYENALHFSPTFRRYAERLADYLVERYQLYGKDVLEIGSSDGAFLADLCRRGNSRGVGFDPGYDPAGATPSGAAVTMVARAYGPDSAHYPADFICCRHVLEHIADPLAFLRQVRAAIGDRAETDVFFEVPDAMYTLREMGIWDIIYEHRSYFTPASLGELFTRSRFDVRKISGAYGGQFLTVEAATGEGSQTPWPRDDGMGQFIDRFAEAYKRKVLLWGRELQRVAETGRKAVVWGAGSKGVTFLNTLGADTDRIAFIVDVNPRKQGKYIPGTAQQVVAPEFLIDYRPDAIIVMNPLYADEVSQTARQMNLAAELMEA